MFTGIVEVMGTVVEVDDREGSRRLVVDVAGLQDIAVGDSIAVSGTCLTAVEVGHGLVAVDVVLESLDRTSLGDLEAGSRVNLERAMPASGRLDGHFVQGHVDGVGGVDAVVPEGDGKRLRVSIPASLEKYVVEKGSVTIDGVSLTVAALAPGVIEVALIPHTLAVTTLGLRKPGEAVNLEVDVLAKYVERLLSSRG